MFIIRFLITAAALWVAVAVVPGITHDGTWVQLLGVALVFGVVNALVRPLIKMLTCPLIILTLGVFLLVLNALMLWLTAELSGTLGLGFHVNGFLAAFWGALLVSVVSAVGNLVFARDRKD
jgi:putative membrane protein